MRTDKDEKAKFSDLLRTPWVRSALKLGLVFTAVGIVLIVVLRLLNIGGTQLFEVSKDFVAQYGLVAIFLVTILAGTAVPLGSPGLVVAAASFGIPKFPLVFVATAGFTIGMFINYVLAFWLGRPYVVKRISPEQLDDIVRLWNARGWYLYAVFGFVPVLPVEFLAFFCGLLKTRLDIFFSLTFLPRLIVFAALAFFGEYLGGWLGFS